MNGIFHNERRVWHGTSSLEPSAIYDDRQDGFMMQFSKQGMWGRGIYFAQRSSYSHSYAHKPVWDQKNRPRSDGKDDEREMFLAKLLVGDEVKLNSDRSLTVPPINPRTHMKYNSVTGETGGSQVWIVYENGRAYPDYLVRYYCGSRNPKKTPYETQHEAIPVTKEKIFKDDGLNVDTTDIASASDSGDAEGDTTVWEFLGSDGNWTAYQDDHQQTLESAHQSASKDKKATHLVSITTSEWTYEVNIRDMKQRNTQHPIHTVREVRRRVVTPP